MIFSMSLSVLEINDKNDYRSHIKLQVTTIVNVIG